MAKPTIRFKGYTEDWEQRKLSELATMHARIGWQNLRTSEFLDAGDYMLITGTDFEDGKVNYSTCHYVEKERYDQDKNIQIKNGNILITKDGTLGKVAYVEGLSLPATLNAGVFNVEVKDENETDSKYLFQFLKAPFLMDYVSKKATGGTIKHLNQNILVDFPIATPSKAEQVRIGEYFSNLDNLITLHHRKCEETKILKKYMLQKMFPQDGQKVPEIRFKGYTEDWEQRKLNEIADKVSEKNKNNEFSEPFTNSAEQGIISQKDYFDREIVNNENLNGYYIVRNDDFIYNPRISVTAPVGPINRNRLGRNGVMSPLYTVFRTHDIDNLYLEFYFKTTKWHRFMKLNGDSGARFDRFTISSTQFMEMPIPYPTLEEQQKIGEYFDSFDNLITLHQRKCEELKNIKKFMLQNMFV
jgi:type I restriction enzyme S subunit